MDDPKPLDTGLLEPAFQGDPEALSGILRWVNMIIDRRGTPRHKVDTAMPATGEQIRPGYPNQPPEAGTLDVKAEAQKQADAERVNAKPDMDGMA